MTKDDEREVQRKLRVLQHAEKIGHVAKTCRYFGIGRASFYRWKRAYERDGEDGLVNAKTIPKNPPNRTPPEVVDRVEFHIPEDDFLKPWQFSSNDGRFTMDFVPILDRHSNANIIVVKSTQHQVFGKFSGTVLLDSGEKIVVKDFLGFAEKVYNRW